MGLTQNELDAVNATGGTPKKGDSTEMLLARLIAPLVSKIVVLTDDTPYEVTAKKTVLAIISGQVTLTPPGEEPTLVEIDGDAASIVLDPFNNSAFITITGSATCNLVIQEF